MVKEIIAPKYCLLCFNYTKNYLCFSCLKNTKFQISFNCLECGKRVNPTCQTKNHSKLIKFLISFADYENKILRDLVILGKKEAFEIILDLGKYIGDMLKRYRFQDYYLVPVPLTKKKLIARGFNQTEILSEGIKQITGQRIFKGLIKIKETKDQSDLDYEGRLKNLESAFALKELPPQKIILVDDIKTTGTTLKKSAEVLKRDGAKEIIALTILR